MDMKIKPLSPDQMRILIKAKSPYVENLVRRASGCRDLALGSLYNQLYEFRSIIMSVEVYVKNRPDDVAARKCLDELREVAKGLENKIKNNNFAMKL